MNVLIAGCGEVGTALGLELTSAGHRAYGLRRDPSRLPSSIHPVAADLTSRAELERVIPEDVDHLVYAASAGGRTREAYEAAYLRGLDNVLEVLNARGQSLRRALFTSSTAVYGQDDGSWVDEVSAAESEQFNGQILLEAETILASASAESASLRLAGIYGPGRTWLVRRVHSGEARRSPPDSPRYGNRIHVEDCAGALRHLLERDTIEATYLGVDDAPSPLNEVYEYVASLLDVAPPPFGDAGSGRGGNKRCTNARLRASGYALKVPTYREGYEEIVKDYLREASEDS